MGLRHTLFVVALDDIKIRFTVFQAQHLVMCRVFRNFEFAVEPGRIFLLFLQTPLGLETLP